MDVKTAHIIEALESVAQKCESLGMIKEATCLDVVANTLEREAGILSLMGKIPEKAKTLAKSLGINLTADKVIDIVTKYFDPKLMGGAEEMRVFSPDFSEKVAALGTGKMLGLLAAILVSGFISQVEASRNPVTVKTPFGSEKTYTSKDLRQLSKTDPKSFTIVMEQIMKQDAEGSAVAQKRQQTQEQARGTKLPGEGLKTVKDRDIKSDAFGNEATLVTYQDGTKQLDGDIMHGGKSLRTLLEQKGELVKDPSAPRVNEQSGSISK